MMREGFLRKGLLFLAAVCCMLVGTVSLADSTDIAWSYSCQSPEYWTAFRKKADTSKVYCHPESGHATYATVYGSKTTSKTDSLSRSGRFKIPVGTRGYITNYVKEKGDTYGALRLERTQKDNTICKGEWSVDSRGTGTIY